MARKPLPEHTFDDEGHDLWGYDKGGHYSRAHDRAPFQASPFATCQQCDSDEPCSARDSK